MAYYDQGRYSSPADYYNEQQQNQRSNLQNVLNMIMTMKQFKIGQAEKQKEQERYKKEWEFGQKKYTTELQQYNKQVDRQTQLDQIARDKSLADIEQTRVETGRLKDMPLPLTPAEEFEQKRALIKEDHEYALKRLEISLAATARKQEESDIDEVNKAKIQNRKMKTSVQQEVIASSINRLDAERQALTKLSQDQSNMILYPGGPEKLQTEINNLNEAIDYLGVMYNSSSNGVLLNPALDRAARAFSLTNINNIKSGKVLSGVKTNLAKSPEAKAKGIGYEERKKPTPVAPSVQKKSPSKMITGTPPSAASSLVASTLTNIPKNAPKEIKELMEAYPSMTLREATRWYNKYKRRMKK